MNSQTFGAVKQVAVVSPARQRTRSNRPSKLRQVARFFLRALIGGAIGGYLCELGALGWEISYYRQNRWLVEAILESGKGNELVVGFFETLPFYLIGGALFAAITGSLTLVFENLIEEKLKVLPCAIATSGFSVLLMIGLVRIAGPVKWTLVLELSPAFIALGFPVGLLARSRLNFWRLLVYGAAPSTASREMHRDSISSTLSIVAAVALRLVGFFGLFTSVGLLGSAWMFVEIHERLVITYAIYYFACTMFVSVFVRTRWMVVAAGSFLNGLLLLLALLWEPSGDVASPLPLALVVLSVLWLLFIGSRPQPLKRRPATSFQEN